MSRMDASRRIAGVDEVGRGSLSGPVVAAAVILPEGFALEGLGDSKALSASSRVRLDALIRESCVFAIGSASVAEIDATDILKATFLAMRRAIAALATPPDHALVDGNRLPPKLGVPATCIVRGDATEAAISAASIVAKVHRDALMADLSLAHPGYGWDGNAGYGTLAHREAIRELGPTPHHRRTFGGVKEWLPGRPPAPVQGMLDLFA